MKILIAEDDQHIGDGLCAVVEAEGYTPILARDGEQALQLFHTHAPQLVLLDIMMPKRDGLDVCRRAREAGLMIPILML